MGMSEQDFWDCTPVHFMRLRYAWLQDRLGMEQARFIAYHVMKAGGYRVRRLTDIVRFSWEKYVPRVNLQPWDSPEIVAFSEAADRALAVLNPEAYSKYMEGKRKREEAPPGPPNGGEEGFGLGIGGDSGDEMRIEAELDF